MNECVICNCLTSKGIKIEEKIVCGICISQIMVRWTKNMVKNCYLDRGLDTI